MARAQEVAMPAVSMSEKLKDNQKSLLRGKYHVSYTDLYRGAWQREKALLYFKTMNKCRHTKLPDAINVMRHMHLFFQIKHTITKTSGRISMVPWL